MDDTKIENNKYDLINESIELINKEFEKLNNSNQNFLIFYIHPKKRSKISNYILKKINKNNNVIDLEKNLLEEFYYDSIHLNIQGHDAISKIINQKIMNYIKID